MKANTQTNNFVLLLFALLAGISAPAVQAFNYSDGDLLLVFRKDGFNDVEYNLGTVSNYLGKAEGTRVPVAGWNLTLVRSNFNSSMAGVKFLLVSATGPTDAIRRIWSTSGNVNPATPVTDLAGSRWGSWRSRISFVGSEATAVSVTNASPVYIVPSSDGSAYTFIASDGGQLDASTMSGLSPFPMESENPATLLFYEVKISNLAVKPAAAILGSFCLESSGVLTFVAGPLAPLPQPTLALSRAGNVNTISFQTTNCGNYRLRFTTDLDAPWTPGTTTVAGDGTVKTLSDTSAGAQRFYEVEVTR